MKYYAILITLMCTILAMAKCKVTHTQHDSVSINVFYFPGREAGLDLVIVGTTAVCPVGHGRNVRNEVSREKMEYSIY